MNLDLPVPTVSPGPGWADSLNTALEVIDEHDHTPGKGMQVPTAGLNLDADLTLNENSLLAVHTLELENLTVAEDGPTNAGRIEQISGDLWYINSAGTAVQLTSGNAISTPTSSNTPAGMIVAYGGASAPSGYLMCDGTAVSRTTFSALFGAIGTVYGVGDGATTFNTPNLIGRTAVMAGTYTDPVSGSVSRTLGAALGAEKHVLTVAELAAHDHGGGSHTHNLNANYTNSGAAQAGSSYSNTNKVGGGAINPTLVNTTIVAGAASSGAIITSQGSNTAHNNMQPTLVVNYIIKT